MRLLLFDEAFLGHHAVWMEEILRVIRDLAPDCHVSYAFPRAFETPATHIEWREPTSHHLLRKVQRWTGRPWLAAAKWRALSTLAATTRADRVLLLYADEFLHAAYVPDVPFEWVPIYFHPRFLRASSGGAPLATLRSRTCPYIYVLDGGIATAMSSLVGKPVLRLPDFCPSVGRRETQRCEAVRLAAAGRPIIGAIGPVTRHKNIGTLLRIAKNRRDWHFLIAGLVFPQALTPMEKSLMADVNQMANVTLVPEYLPHDEMNALTAMCDVQYAAYTNFPHSSNKLVRACEYRTLLVVAETGYMAEMVTRYRIGEVCDPISDVSVTNAIARCCSSHARSPDWQGYLAENSLETLRDTLRPFVASNIAETVNNLNAGLQEELT